MVCHPELCVSTGLTKRGVTTEADTELGIKWNKIQTKDWVAAKGDGEGKTSTAGFTATSAALLFDTVCNTRQLLGDCIF